MDNSSKGWFGIRCPHCGSARTKVIDSRKIAGGVRRRRECYDCAKRHSTIEVMQNYIRQQKFTPAQIQNKTRAIQKYQKRKKTALDDAPSPG